MKEIIVDSEYKLLEKMIDIALILKLPEKYMLLPRQKEFIIYTILISHKGLPLESKEMVSEISKKMGIKNADVYNYRKILKDKGWLNQTMTGFSLPPFLNFSKKSLPKTLNLNYRIVLDDNTQREKDNK